MVNLLLALLYPQPATASPTMEVTREAIQMGTFSRVTVSSADRNSGLLLAGSALDAIEEAEAVLSTWRSASEVSAINQAPVDERVLLSPALIAFLQPAFELARVTGHAFDPGVGALSHAWGVHGSPRIPVQEERESARLATGEWSFDLDPAGGTICRLHPMAALDTGGFGKGAGLDRAGESLRARGARRALLDLGGQSLAVGGPFVVGVAHPGDRTRIIAALSLKDASVATSGNGERPIGASGERERHILDPRTGEPARDFGSVTVVAATGLEADALATALFVLGPESGLTLAASLPGIEALFTITSKDGALRGLVTPGFSRLLQDVDPILRLESPADRLAERR